jgi:ADP-ribose pyrophosphatase YjhB (NUDIX family)
MKHWVVASGIVEQDGSVLLVQNKRRNRGTSDWSPPGGVVEVDDGEAVIDALTREVEEETGLRVTAWAGPVWEVHAESPVWTLRVEVYRALAFEGDIVVDDPDGIVVDARFVPCDSVGGLEAEMWLPTHEPLVAWLAERWDESRAYRYKILEGASPQSMQISRLE